MYHNKTISPRFALFSLILKQYNENKIEGGDGINSINTVSVEHLQSFYMVLKSCKIFRRELRDEELVDNHEI